MVILHCIVIINLLQVVTRPMEKDVQRAIIEYSKKTGRQLSDRRSKDLK